jgi:molybdopterin converting factor subunit 1
MTIKVRYFASLRDIAGKSEEMLDVSSCTAESVYTQLQAQYGFLLDSSELRAAINGSFAEMNTIVQSGDELVFIPPVSGG